MNDALYQGEIMTLLEIDPDELNFQPTVDKLEKVMEYFAEYADARYIIMRVLAANPTAKKLDLIYQYCQMREELEEKREGITQLEEAISRLEGN